MSSSVVLVVSTPRRPRLMMSLNPMGGALGLTSSKSIAVPESARLGRVGTGVLVGGIDIADASAGVVDAR